MGALLDGSAEGYCRPKAQSADFGGDPEKTRRSRHRLRTVSGQNAESSDGFTLLELLAVISIIVVLMTLLVPTFSSRNNVGELTKATYDIAGFIEQARAYAMANNTYVYVGITETDASLASSNRPQQKGNGRVAVAMVASKNGQRNYDVSDPGLWTLNYTARSGNSSYAATIDNLVPLGKLQHFENVHLDLLVTGTAGGLAARKPVIATGSTPYAIAAITASISSATPFAWPLTKDSTLSGGYQYLFNAVINFDPQGVARIQYNGNLDAIPSYIEIGLRPTHGSTVDKIATNVAVIQIDGMTGATHIYRP